MVELVFKRKKRGGLFPGYGAKGNSSFPVCGICELVVRVRIGGVISGGVISRGVIYEGGTKEPNDGRFRE